VEVYKAGSTLAANSRGIKRFLTPSLAACWAHTRGWCTTPCSKTWRSRNIKSVWYACGKKYVLPQGVAHRAARCVFLVGIKNCLMPRELAACVLPALGLVSCSGTLWISRVFSEHFIPV
jgi:hypothetical protein